MGSGSVIWERRKKNGIRLRTISNRKLYQTEGATDFRERVSRPIWPSKLGLSTGYRILPAKVILSFASEVFPSLPVFAGGPSGLSKPENSEAPFSKTFQHGCVGD